MALVYRCRARISGHRSAAVAFLESLVPWFMQNARAHTIGITSTLVLTVLLLWWRLPDFPAYANTRVIEPYGDGYKAYATYLYHINHDSTYSWYQGMNYPFGDHVIPSDTQPLLANSVRWISNNLMDIRPYALGIYNWSMPLGIVLCSLFLFLILARVGLPWWYSVPIAVALTFMAPQWWRMISHFGLAHPEVLPILLYLLLLYDERPSWRISAWIGLSLFLFALLHFYYVAIMGMTIGLYFAFRVWRGREWRQVPLYAAHIALQVLLPAGILMWWMSMGAVSDRTAQPAGYLLYLSIWESIFTSLSQPHWQWVNDHLIKIEQGDFEGYAYVGVVATLTTLFVLVRLPFGKFKRPALEISGQHSGYFEALFWAAALILIFSFGYPFVIDHWDGLLNYAGPIRQFRSIGRFAWVFYYVINLVAFVWLYQQVKHRAVMVLAILLLSVEAWYYNRGPDLKLDDIAEFSEGQTFLDIPGMDYSQYQAVLTVPYYNIGSDNLSAFGNDGFILQKSLTIGMQTGLPTTSAMLTRSSLSQTILQFQLMSEPYRRPVLLDSLADRRPFLLAVNTQKLAEAYNRDWYGHLPEGAVLLHERGNLSLYALPLDLFEQRIAARRERLLREAESTNLHSDPPFLLDNPNFTFIYQSCDEQPSSRVYRGAGAWNKPVNKKQVLLDDRIPGQWPGGAYTFAAWVYIGDDLAARTRLDLEEYDPQSGAILQEFSTWFFFQIKLVDPSGWALVEYPFMPKSADSKLRFSVHNNMMPGRSLYVDDILIRATAAQMYQLGADGLWYNNRWFPVDAE